MTTTTDIARRHGHTGAIVCEDCGTTENLHFGSWFDPKTGQSGDFLQCCACGLKAGDPAYIHDDCASDAGEVEESEADVSPEVRVHHRPGGWVLPDYSDLADCTTNFHREQDGRPPCTDTAVWKVVEDHGLHLSIGFYCDADLPAEHRPAA
ncbi:hypothetical protein AB0872_20620 [Microbacterium sp. NPDC047426]